MLNNRYGRFKYIKYFKNLPFGRKKITVKSQMQYKYFNKETKNWKRVSINQHKRNNP